MNKPQTRNLKGRVSNMAVDINALRAIHRPVEPKAGVAAPPPSDSSDYVPLGVDGLLRVSEKLLHINQGLTEPDDRDSYAYKKAMRANDHLAERITLDSGGVKRGIMSRIVRTGSLKHLSPYAFDSYSRGLIIGTSDEPNQLSSPLEETNPMQLLENAYRFTMMGAGGIGSDDQITADAQAVNGTQFGFVDPLSGPESQRAGVDVRLVRGARVSNTGKIYARFKNARTGEYEWMTPLDMSKKVLAMPD